MANRASPHAAFPKPLSRRR